MAYKYEVTINGGKYLVESEKELSDNDAFNLAKQQAETESVQNAVVPTQQTVRAPYSAGAEAARSAGQGLTLGFADELEAALRTGAISGAEYEKLRNQLRNQQASFKEDYPKTALATELAGGLALPAGMVLKAGKAVPSMYKTIATGAGLGGAQGYGSNTSEESAASDVLLGAGLGGGISGGLGLAGRAISPELQKGAREIMREGIPLTLGNALGGGVQAAEQMAESLPFVTGPLIKGARQKGFEQLNKAVLNRALAPLGKDLKVPDNLGNREGLQFVRDAISSEYNRIYPNVKLELNKTLDRQLQSLENRYSKGKLADDQLNQFKSRIEDLKSQLAKGQISGPRVKAIREDLADDVVRYKQARGAEATLGDAFEDLNNSIGMSLQNQNKGFRKEIRKADEAYANFVRAQTATARSSGQDGVYSPAQLAQAVRSSDVSKRKGKTATGEALMSDLANRATDVLGNKVPDSGTAGRGAMLAALTGGASYLNPKFAIPTALASGLYTDAGMNVLNKYLRANRPAPVELTAQTIKQASPYLNFGLLTQD